MKNISYLTLPVVMSLTSRIISLSEKEWIGYALFQCMYMVTSYKHGCISCWVGSSLWSTQIFQIKRISTGNYINPTESQNRTPSSQLPGFHHMPLLSHWLDEWNFFATKRTSQTSLGLHSILPFRSGRLFIRLTLF